MTEADFDVFASQLLKEIGVKDTGALNFFQTNPHSSEWKASIKVPSPPKLRRSTISSGTTYTRQAPKEGSQQNGTGVRRHSGERVLRTPQYHSSSSTNGGTSETSKQSTGGSGGKFGYGTSAANSNNGQLQQATTSPTRRVIARPAPKPPVQTTGNSAKKPEYTKVAPAPMKLTSSAGALLNGGHVSVATKTYIPTTVKAPTTEPSSRGAESVDRSKISRLASPTKTQPPKEQLRRIASNPDRSTHPEAQKSTIEIVQTKPASFQMLSTSSHRILHTSEDGGSSKRKPSLKTGYYTETHQAPGKPQPMKALPLSRTQALTSATVTQSKSSSDTRSTTSSALSPSEPPRGVSSKSSGQSLKPSEKQSLSGAYDRLSPVELAAIRQISEEAKVPQPQSQPYGEQRKSSTASSSSEGKPDQDSKPLPTQTQAKQSGLPLRRKSEPVSAVSRTDRDSKPNGQPVHRKTSSPVSLEGRADHSDKPSQTPQSRASGQILLRKSSSSGSSIENRPSEEKRRPATYYSYTQPTLNQQPLQRKNSVPLSAGDQSSKPPSTHTEPKRSHQPLQRKGSIPLTIEVKSDQENKQTSTQAHPQISKTSNLPVTSSKQPSSSQDEREHRRNHSSEEKQLRFSPTPQKPGTNYTHVKLERNTQSPSSSSTTTVSSPDSVSDRQTPDSDDRRARLDNMNWSRQSLDKNLNTVATSTVQALSTLIEVLTPDPTTKLSTQFRYDTPTLNPNWYAETDDSDTTSSYPLSPLSPEPNSSEPTTSPRGRSPLTTSVSDSSISSVTKSEPRVVQRVRFADNPVEIIHTSSRKAATKTVPVTKEASLKVSARSPSREVIEEPEKPPPKPDSAQQPKSPAPQPQQTQEREEPGKKEVAVPQKSALKPVPTVKRKESAEEPTGAKVNGLSNGMDSSIHDYAVIDPKFHDYAVLDPEYNPEFYGYCQRCTKPVIGMDTGCFALDSVYHLKCFTCSKCSISLSGHSFYTADDQVLCEADYWSLLETCHACSQEIQDRVLRALDRSYHPECFRCSTCDKCLDGVPYISDASNLVYCIPDYHEKYAPRCAACEKPILPEQGRSRSLRVRTTDKSYHVECYKCESCKKQLANKSGHGEKCYPIEGHLFCKLCSFKYSQKNRSGSTKSKVPRKTVSTSLL